MDSHYLNTPSAKLFQATALRGRTDVVTDAARGIGLATTVALAHAGADVAGIDICAVVDPRSGVEPAYPAELEETGRLVQQAGRRWHQTILDQRDMPAVRQAALQIDDHFGAVDILFANAGIQQFHPLMELEDADWNITIDNNLTGTANMLRAFGPSIGKPKYAGLLSRPQPRASMERLRLPITSLPNGA